MECLEELEQLDNIIFPIGVGCSSNLGAGLECDRLHCCHGRAGAVATGMKRVNPDTLIVSYQGDGDAYNIGIAKHLACLSRPRTLRLSSLTIQTSV